MPDWMFECDAPGCGERYLADDAESLRGTGDRGMVIGRRWAALEGWTNRGELDYCPEHALTTKEN